MLQYYKKDAAKVLEELESAKSGLSQPEADARLEKDGPNKLNETKKKTMIGRFIEQIANPMVIVLIVAAVISGVMEEVADMIIILLVVLLNSVLGVVQESKSEKAIEALQAMTSSMSKVKRGDEVKLVKSQEIVVGDIVLIEAGDSVPADMRLIESASLKIEEAALTGESVPVDKSVEAISSEDEVPLGDRKNMAYMGSSAVYGRGAGVVIATGMQTEMGKIADIIAKTKEGETPLQKKLGQLSKLLSFAVLGVCAFVFAFSLIRSGNFSGEAVLDTFMLAVSLAVAAIPEGLAAVVTIVLSIGVTNMSKKSAIIRKLTAVETLGCAQVICSDKTGTLTQNKMKVVSVYGDEKLLAEAMALCSDAQVSGDGKTVLGEPTESALVRYALELELSKNELQERMPRVGEAPFDSERKMMSTIHVLPKDGYLQYTKGAPDEVLKKCSKIMHQGEIVAITDEHRNIVIEENKKMAAKALRVLSAAYKPLGSLPDEMSPDTIENDLIFIGLAGMIDPVRPEVKAAIADCRSSGIRPIMITGDHRDTAAAIGLELGIIADERQAITGSDLNAIPDEEFEKKVEEFSVYARVQPEHKVRIVNAWKKLGRITAMTGDGVNDAPALKASDIGVGMGITGTDVTKNVADMVLADDNFATIVSAVKEGRRIYDNIRKAIQFLLSSNLSEVVTIFVATLLGEVIFAPVHILWINLVTDSLPAIALGMEGPERNIMSRRPRDAKESIFANGVAFDIVYQGVMVAVLTLVAYFIGLQDTHEAGMTMAFLTLSMCEIFHSYNMRSQRDSIFALKTQNRILIVSMVVSLLLTTMLIYTPFLAKVFSLQALSNAEYFSSIALAFLVIPIVEIVKLIQRMAARTKA